MLNFKHKTINPLISNNTFWTFQRFNILTLYMANEIGPSTDGLEIGWWVREDVNKVTEEAVRRVQDNQKKAKQAQQQIQQDKQNNAKFAQFLTFLLKKLTNDVLVTALYDVFFKTKHPKTDITYLRKSINTIVVVGMFAPFFPAEIQQFGLAPFFDKLIPLNKKPNITDYLSYLKNLSKTYHDNIPIDKTAFIKFLIQILMEFGLVNKETMTEDQKKELQLGLQKELYGK